MVQIQPCTQVNENEKSCRVEFVDLREEKVSEGYGVCRGKLEYEDIAKIARENGMSLEEVKELVEK